MKLQSVDLRVADVEATARFFAFGTSAESWLNHPVQHDLWHAEQWRKALKVVKLAA